MQSPDWFQSSLGLWLMEKERERCQQLVPDGYYPSALQLGLPQHDFLEGIEIGNRYLAVLPSDALSGELPDAVHDREPLAAAEQAARQVNAVHATPGALPFSDKTHSLIVLPHVLDFCSDPHAVLREVNQILIPEGCLVISGFNPASLWRTPQLDPRSRKHRNAPWKGHHYRVKRVQDWLALLGFDIVGARMLAYSPPLQNEKWRNRFGFLEQVGDRWWPALAAGWIVVARKREIASSAGGMRRSWQRFIPAIARPAVSSAGLANVGRERPALRLVVSNKILNS